MKPVFEEHGVDQALEKIAEAILHPSGGYGAPSWAETNGKDVVEMLRWKTWKSACGRAM